MATFENSVLQSTAILKKIPVVETRIYFKLERFLEKLNQLHKRRKQKKNIKTDSSEIEIVRILSCYRYKKKQLLDEHDTLE